MSQRFTLRARRANALGFYFVILAAVLICGAPRVVKAHVLVPDQTGRAGAILHSIPDDDPIAGEPASLFFDIKGLGISKNTHTFTLTSQSDAHGVQQLPIAVTDEAVAAIYTFPEQGMYTLKLLAESSVPQAAGSVPTVFVYNQRISRGAVGSQVLTPRHVWAEVGLVASACTLSALGIGLYHQRKKLAKHQL